MQQPPVRHRRSQRPQNAEPLSAQEVPVTGNNRVPDETLPDPVTPAPRYPYGQSASPDTFSSVPASEGQIVRHTRARGDIQVSNLPPEMQEKAQKQLPLPRPLLIALCAALILFLGLFLTEGSMRGYLKKQQDARDTAWQKLLEGHPFGYESMIRENAERFNLQPSYVAAIILNESHFDPRAVSSVGARGLMQLMPDTAQWIAGKLQDKSYSFENMFDPQTNIRYGCWYLNYLSGLFAGDPVAVTSAYHAGQGTVRTWLQDGKSSTDNGRTLNLLTMPEGPTKIYAGRVTNAYAIYDAIYDHVLNPLPDDTVSAAQ
ncbi:MAG: lytic transglycosylase domain-containing protein [Clostridia bacterium]|nr:lytic transglycosylase domain-containing protein [Clostridia bacterium]